MKHWNTDPHWKPAKHATWWGSDSMKHPPKPNLPRRFLVNKIAEGLHLGSIYVLLCDLCFCELSDLVFFLCFVHWICCVFFLFSSDLLEMYRWEPRTPTPSTNRHRQATSPWNLARSKALSACSWFTTLGKTSWKSNDFNSTHVFHSISTLCV